MKILVIDNNIDRDSWGAQDLRRMISQTAQAEVYVRRAPADDLPETLSVYDKIIVSGSKTSVYEQAPWIDRLDVKLREALERKIPILGVCYGQQALARILGGRQINRKSGTPEIGWTLIEQVRASEILKGLSKQFYSFSMHYEEVAQLPPGTAQLARSERCELQAFEVIGYPAYGIQFHPEKDQLGATKTIAEKKKKGEFNYLLQPDHTDRLFDPRVGGTIFENFLKLMV